MNQVIYASRGGNTKKLAEAIAKAVGVSAVSVEQAGALNAVDVLFVGASIYGGSIDGKLRGFLQELKSTQVKKVVVFGTSAGKKTALSEIKSILEASGITVSEEEFHCKGSFLFAHRGHPDGKDLQAAESFAKRVCGI